MLVDRMIRAARLDPSVYNELERDRNATSQALIVVVIVAIANGLGQLLSGVFGRQGGVDLGSLIGGVIGSLLGWVVWSYVTYFVGTRLFGGRATPGELLRCIGFAYTPNILGFFVFIPCLGWLAALAGGLWALVAVIIALREALDVSTGQAIATAVVGFVAVLAIWVVFSLLGFGFALAF